MQSGRDGRGCVLHLTTDAEDLTRLHPWLDSVTAEFGLPEAMLFGMHVALEEAVANAARHGFDAGVVAEVCVRLSVERGEAVLVVEDSGRAFDASAAPLPARPTRLEDAAPGGAGLRLIRHYCAALEYQRRDGRNRLTLRFNAPA